MDDEYDFLELPTPATAHPSASKNKTHFHQHHPQKQIQKADTAPGSLWSFLIAVASSLIAAIVVVVALQLNTISLPSTKWVVDVDKCTCDCWDRAYKGNYGHGGYKHVYFQMTKGTILLWLWSAVYFALLLEFVKRATACVLGSVFRSPTLPRVRWPVLFLSCINFYGMFYNWWITFNYINDAGLRLSYNILLPTQLFFDITDVIPAIALYKLLPSASTFPPPLLLSTSLTISVSHIFLSLWDQGLNHLLTGSGAVLRDLMFVLSDLAAVVVFVYFFRQRLRRPAARGRLLLSIITLSTLYLLLKHLAGYDVDS